MITQNYLKQIFEYKDGNLYYKEPCGKMKIGKKAGSKRTSGYIAIVINKKPYYSHRLIFAMFHGFFPKFIDHINGNKSDNRIENLREATKAQNQFNIPKLKNNTSGIKCVSWSNKDKKWIVRLSVNKKNKYFGGYFDIQVAKFVAETMRHKYHGQFANHK